MRNEQIIDTLLNECFRIKTGIRIEETVRKLVGKDSHRQLDEVLEIIKSNNLAYVAYDDIITPNDRTNDIVNSGGYLSLLNKIEEEKNRQSLMQEKSDEKLGYDLSLSKWQKKTFWPVFIGGLIGLGLSMYSTATGYLTQSQLENTERRIDTLQNTVKSLSEELLKHDSDTSKLHEKRK